MKYMAKFMAWMYFVVVEYVVEMWSTEYPKLKVKVGRVTDARTRYDASVV